MKRIAAAFLIWLLPLAVLAQQLPVNLPASTVFGRLANGPGPAQAIPFATLNTNLLNNLCTTAGALPVYNATTGKWQCSTVAGSQAVLNPLLNFAVSGAQSGAGLFIGAQSGGSGLTGSGPISAGFASITEGTAGSSAVIDKIGWISACSIVVNDTSGSGCYAGNDSSTVNGGGASINRLVGRECDITIKSGAGTVAYRYCFSAVNETNGVGTGATLDTAFFIGNIGNSSGAWLNGLTASNSLGVTPIAAAFNWFQCDYACTFADFAHFPTATVTGDILNFANVTITGAGAATFAGNVGGNALLSNTLNDAVNAHNIASRSGTSEFFGAGSILTIADAGPSTFTGSVFSSSPSGGVGYTTGAGGAVTQITSRTTGVTLNKITGAITLLSAAGSATPATFTVTNSSVAATDTITINQKSGTNLYETFVTAVAAGSFNITFFTTGGTATDSPVFNFSVIKGSAN